MGLKGQLTRDKLGFSMPADAPLYPRPPYLYKDAELLVFPYVTDAQAASKILPEGLELDDTPIAGLVFAAYPQSGLGPYNEVVSFVHCKKDGKPFQYAARLYVTTDVAMAAGREMGGYPKAMAHIEFHRGSMMSAWMDRPAGIRLCSGVFRPETPMPARDFPFPVTLSYVTLRMFPTPQENAPPSLAELLETSWVLERGEAWSGTGSFQITGASAVDPLHALPVVAPIPQQAHYIRGDMVVALNKERLESPF